MLMMQRGVILTKRMLKKSEDAEEEDIGGFWGGMEDLDSMARVNWVCVACEASGRGCGWKRQ